MKRLAKPVAALLAVLAAAGWLGLSPATPMASARSIPSRVRLAYEQQGLIPPCEFTSPQLTAAQNAVDAYGLEYFADYIAAIQNALTLRAAGACSKHTAAVHHARLGHIPPEAPLPATLTAPTRSDVPVPMLLMAIFTVMLAGAAGLLMLGRRRGSSADWADRWQHATAEARYRAENLRDSILNRLGR